MRSSIPIFERTTSGEAVARVQAQTAAHLSQEEWLTTEEAAAYLKVPVGSFRNLVSNGRIRPRGKLGRLNRFLRSDLRELLLGKN